MVVTYVHKFISDVDKETQIYTKTDPHYTHVIKRTKFKRCNYYLCYCLNISALDDVRGFVRNGYETLKNKEGDIAYLVCI